MTPGRRLEPGIAGHDLRRGAGFMITATLLFATMAACIKHASADLPTGMIVFFRNAISLATLLPWLARQGVSTLRTTRWRTHLFRAGTGLASMYAMFHAIGGMPLAEAMLLNYAAPLYIPLLAALGFDDRPPARLWGPILLGFAGIALILKPGAAMFTPVAMVAMAAGVLAAMSWVSVRRLARTEPATRVVFYLTVLGTGLSAAPLPFVWQTPTLGEWLLLCLIGAIGTVGQLALTRAYACAPAAQIGPFTYTAVLFSGIFGWLFWREMPDGLSLAGATIVCIAGIWTLRIGTAPAPR
ncbi:MAG: DMT family transporter [Steroidobacteraceae bacterium]